MANKKNIILISPFWTGIRSFFLNGNIQFSGMPAFTNTFMHLLNDDRVGTVYTVFLGTKIATHYSLNEKYKEKLRVFGYSYSNRVTALISFIKAFSRIIWLIITKEIHVIYGHGSIGGIAGLIGNLTGVPNVRRIYGTFLSTKITDSKKKIFFSHPLEYFAFSLPAKAVIITNDGTKGDLVFQKIGNKKTPFYFWLNGIDKTNVAIKPYEDVAKEYGICFKPEVCYIARIDKWKRQHLLVDILVEAKKRKKIFKTIIAGPVTNESYFDSLKKKIVDNGLEKTVCLIPGLTKVESLSVISNSVLSVSFYDVSNLGNVFLESLSLGTLMLSENINGSLSLIDSEVYIDVDPKNSEIAVGVIENLLNDDAMIKSKVAIALKFSHEILLTWEQRTINEIELLKL